MNISKIRDLDKCLYEPGQTVTFTSGLLQGKTCKIVGKQWQFGWCYLVEVGEGHVMKISTTLLGEKS